MRLSMLTVGPESAGSAPGPICFGRGGTRPTVTDANLILGRLPADRLLAVRDAVPLDHVRAIFARTLAEPLGIGIDEAAAAVLRLSNTHMAGAIRMVSLSRGHDPRDFVLFAFGGAGPLHAVALAGELGIPEVLVPARPGLTNALGCLVADMRQDFVQTVNVALDAADVADFERILREQEARGRRINAAEQDEIVATDVLRSLDMQFRGQTHLIRVALPAGSLSRAALQSLFEDAYFKRFEIRMPEIKAVVVNLNTSVIGRRRPFPIQALIDGKGRAQTIAGAATDERLVHAAGRWHTAPVYARDKLPISKAFAGPAIVEQIDATVVIEPGCIGGGGRDRQSAYQGGLMTVRPIDPLTLAVIQAGLGQVCNEMDIAFSRAAFSPVIAEADDRADGIYDRDRARSLRRANYGLPVFVGTMQASTEHLVRLIGEGKAGRPEPGDIYIVNDPYLGGTHLMDVRFVLPFYYRGEHVCWLQNTGHWPDVGGAVPGGFSAKATEVEQEGLRLPPVKLFKRGVMDAEIYAIIMSNIRVADQRIGDIKAQAAALKVGERRSHRIDRSLWAGDVPRGAWSNSRRGRQG